MKGKYMKKILIFCAILAILGIIGCSSPEIIEKKEENKIISPNTPLPPTQS